MFVKFPCEVGPPRKVVKNIKEYLAYINLNNGKKTAIYKSVYKFDEIITEPYVKPDYNSAVVDCIYFDFDDKSCNAWNECFKLHFDCMKMNYKHSINMSGRGFHCFIYINNHPLSHKKEAIRGGQEYFIKQNKLTVDAQVIGNVAQMARIPNTYHPKAKRFCIPLTREQFEQGDSFCKSLAEHQNFVKDIMIGDKLFDISVFDVERETKIDLTIPSITNRGPIKKGDVSPLIARLMCNENAGWKDRYLIILYFKELDYSKDDVFDILKDCLSEKKFYHCVREEKQLQYLFSRDDLLFPSFEKLRDEGRCMSKKEYGDGVYK